MVMGLISICLVVGGNTILGFSRRYGRPLLMYSSHSTASGIFFLDKFLEVRVVHVSVWAVLGEIYSVELPLSG